MKKFVLVILILGVAGFLTLPYINNTAVAEKEGSNCVNCHKAITPGAVNDWKLSKHSENEVGCEACHGDKHNGASNVDLAEVPTPDTCATCHSDRVEQYKKGKHALAWAAMKAMPTIHWQPMELIDGMKGCGGCHKIGLKSKEEITELKKKGYKFGNAACDSCHTRHTFSVKEARQPQACQTCHMGFDHPQWEMYSGSKHGVRALLKQNGILHQDSAGPTCQDCHMQDGNHEVITAWGFLAVRLPLSKNEQWKKDQITILKALGVLNPETGEPTGRLDVVKGAKVARLTQEEWQDLRNKKIKTCSKCHSKNFAKTELEKGDKVIQQIDRLMAEAIEIVGALYKDGIIPKPENYSFNYPDLLTFHDAPTPIEETLFVMFLKHRMRAFQGVFHMNPDYALWYGWSEMKRDLTEIRSEAKELREKKAIK